MNIYALICVRSTELSDTAKALVAFLSECGIKVKLMVNQPSIFEGYKNGLAACNAQDNDIIILCHDDLIIRSSKEEFLNVLLRTQMPGIGFIGVAGTSRLEKHCIWWKSRKECLSGKVHHVDVDGQIFPTIYGMCKEVAVLDGLFLATTAKVLRDINLTKPEFFVGGWDFYDLYYTMQACKKGYHNFTMALDIVHKSLGIVRGGGAWDSNRLAFSINLI